MNTLNHIANGLSLQAAVHEALDTERLRRIFLIDAVKNTAKKTLSKKKK